MTLSRFDSDSTLKTLNLSFLRFNERSGFQNLSNHEFTIRGKVGIGPIGIMTYIYF